MQERKAAKEKIQSLVAPQIMEAKISYVVDCGFPHPQADSAWDDFVDWMQINYHSTWLKYNILQRAFKVIDGLSGDELQAYTNDTLDAIDA